jgi:hypothetical protein
MPALSTGCSRGECGFFAERFADDEANLTMFLAEKRRARRAQ